MPPAHWIVKQFNRTDDGAGGRWATWQRGIKFWGRCMWHGAHIDSCQQTLDQLGLSAMLAPRSEIVLRPLRSYLRSGLTPRERTRAVGFHFEWMSRHLRNEVIEGLALDKHRYILSDGLLASGLQISLKGVSNQSREGELCLELLWQGQRLMFLLFNIVETQAVMPGNAGVLGACALVGGVQGVRGTEQAFKEATYAVQRLRPVTLLVTALQGLCRAWGLGAPLGVASQAHVYAQYRRRSRKVALDYDAVWSEAGAQRVDIHHWLLPDEPQLRPESEVDSKRRAQHRRRNALKSELFLAVQRPAQALL